MTGRSLLKIVSLLVALAAVLAILAGEYFVMAGVSARPQPGTLETLAARTVRQPAIRWHASRAERRD